MNAQEQTLVTQLLGNLQQAASQLPPDAVDSQANLLITQAFSANPHMAYLLTQRHLLLEQALHNAQARIQTLEQAQTNPPRTESASFLGTPSHGWSNPAPAVAPASATLNAYGQPIGRAAPPVAPTMDAPAQAAMMNAAPAASRGNSLGGGSFLGTAAAAATGVVGGALLFQGIEHLMGGGHSGLMGAGNALPTENITNVTENYYGNQPNPDLATADSSGGWDNSAFNDPNADPINDPASDSNMNFDPTADNSSLFDSASTDDSGGFFGGLFGGGSGDDDWV
ncbi:MAG: DUF2076 domain-containing protein [Halothiobacillus sp.]